MNTNSQNINNNNNFSGENSMSTIQQLFNEFVNQGGNPKVTEFKKHINSLISSDIKPLCTHSGKAGDNWKSDLKAQFGGRGAKWVFVSLAEVEPTLQVFEKNGVDCTVYRKNTQKLGKAWIRFSGPRTSNGENCAAFEVRTQGATIDHPKQLHYIPASLLDGNIETIGSTPKALKLEEDSAPMPKSTKMSKAKKQKPVEVYTQSIQVLANEINDELANDEVIELNEAPQSGDPAEWEAFLAAEGLIDPELDDFNDMLNDDEF